MQWRVASGFSRKAVAAVRRQRPHRGACLAV